MYFSICLHFVSFLVHEYPRTEPGSFVVPDTPQIFRTFIELMPAFQGVPRPLKQYLDVGFHGSSHDALILACVEQAATVSTRIPEWCHRLALPLQYFHFLGETGITISTLPIVWSYGVDQMRWCMSTHYERSVAPYNCSSFISEWEICLGWQTCNTENDSLLLFFSIVTGDCFLIFFLIN